MPFVQREPFCKVQHQMANLQPEAERQVLLLLMLSSYYVAGFEHHT